MHLDHLHEGASPVSVSQPGLIRLSSPARAIALDVLRVISGTHYFSSRTPTDYAPIQTPTVTAAIRGTEFVVEVAANGATTVTMLEGVVDASNEHGAVTVSAGEAETHF